MLAIIKQPGEPAKRIEILTGLPYNMDFAGIRFVGPVLVVGRSEDDFRSLTDEEFTAIMRWIFKQAGESK